MVELLTVIAIIAILAALTLGAAGPVMNVAARSRAHGEIQAMCAALESYKADNGAYPQTSTTSSTLATNSASATYYCTSLDGNSSAYQVNSQVLYTALSGQTNFLDTPTSAANGGNKVYMTFKKSQVGNATASSANGNTIGNGSSYVQDPWSYSYGYSTGTTLPAVSYPFSGNGFFDLWSTGGTLHSGTATTNAWLSNWAQ